MNTNEVNSFGMTKDQVDKLYTEEASEAANKLIRKHAHWVKKGYCSICGRKVNSEES